MTPAQQSAPVRHWNADAGARTPSLTDKAGTVDPIMHDRLARRSQRHAAQRRPVEAERRIATLEALLHITQQQMVADSLLLCTDSTHRIVPDAPDGHPESLTAELPEEQEVALAALSNDLWPHDEYLDITP